MSKKKRFSDGNLGSPLSGFTWDFRIFCQSPKKEKLECLVTFPRVVFDAGNTCRKLTFNVKHFKELKACPISLSIPEIQDVPLQELWANESAKFRKCCKNKFSGLKVGRVEKQQKMSLKDDKMIFQALTQMSHQETWRCHAVQSLPFLLDEIQMKKMRLRKEGNLGVSIGFKSITVY